MENIERIEKWKGYNFFSYTCDKNEKKRESMRESIVWLKEKTKRIEL